MKVKRPNPGQTQLFDSYGISSPIIGPKGGDISGYVFPGIACTEEVSRLIAQDAPVAIGVSGGKDSSAAALATVQYLVRVGHNGPRLLIHSDLGRVEWTQSITICERLARQLGLELVVVSWKQGDMVDRWRKRWEDNSSRYANLELVKVLLPWSTSGMRFCTGELKTTVISQYLTARFSGQTIISVTGIRRQESNERQKKPVASWSNDLSRNPRNGPPTAGINWHPIIDWTLTDVWALHHRYSLPIHEAYTQYNMNRVSCAFCILASQTDLLNSTTYIGNRLAYSLMVDLEIESTFSFKEGYWLADIKPAWLSDEQRAGVIEAKRRSKERQRIEAAIPAHLLYEKGWPLVLPSPTEAQTLACVRNQIANLLELSINYVDKQTILDRYRFLMDEKDRKDVQQKKRTSEIIHPITGSVDGLFLPF